MQELANGHVKKDHAKKKQKKTSSFTLPDELDEVDEGAVHDSSAAPEPEPTAAEGSDEEDADAALAAAHTNGSKKKGKKGKRAAFVLPEEPEAAAEEADEAPKLAASTAPEAEPAVTDGAAALDDDADASQPTAAPQEPADAVPVFGKKKKKKTADAASLFAALDLDADAAANGAAGDVAHGDCCVSDERSVPLTVDAEPGCANACDLSLKVHS